MRASDYVTKANGRYEVKGTMGADGRPLSYAFRSSALKVAAHAHGAPYLYQAGQTAYIRQPIEGETRSGRQKRRIYKAAVLEAVTVCDETARIQEEGKDPITIPAAWLAGPVYEVS